MTHTIDPAGKNRKSLMPILFGVAVLLMLLGQWKPLAFLDIGGEPWVFVLSEAAAGRYRFGVDIRKFHDASGKVVSATYEIQNDQGIAAGGGYVGGRAPAVFTPRRGPPFR